jgi:Icc-related predicted phosphoesterase
MRIVAISDTHGSHFGLSLPDGDMLIHCGDFSSEGGLKDTFDFLSWFNTHPHQHKIFIAGNHDWLCERDPALFKSILEQFPDLTYLQDNSVKVNGLLVHGSPVQPRFYNWAFNRDRGEDIKRHWDMIPDGTDVLITHGPPYGYCDIAPRTGFYGVTERTGCKDLLDAIKQVKPKIWVGGHIHYSYGVGTINHDDGSKTMCYNSSVLNEDYVVSNKPWIINI